MLITSIVSRTSGTLILRTPVDITLELIDAEYYSVYEYSIPVNEQGLWQAVNKAGKAKD